MEGGQGHSVKGAGQVVQGILQEAAQHRLTRKASDAAIFGFHRPREMEEMRPEREPLQLDCDRY